ncbi:hypothetical protein SCLCIDRAFT_1143275 [Scleroderma citrinum Foug A]|uniref:OPT superfamily oligopeptide transporter n=1 Tax=Scleroderma citrinum Foug A TaxID=1036808 RepID=A0A0C3B0Y6_9AGAM|nr:hypothetical protein SCLCIDRAFT_1143275 [Scleroderma citrinum Foug A]
MTLQLSDRNQIGGMFAHCLCFWGPELMEICRNAHLGIQPDPHWKAMQKYKEGQTTMAWYFYIVALLLGALVTSFTQIFYACLGNGIHTDQLMKLIGGFILPSKPVANSYFAMWSNGLIGQSITFAIGIIVQNSSIISQKTALLDSEWSVIWSSIGIKNINNNAIMWSFSNEFYGQHGPYFIVVLSLLYSAWLSSDVNSPSITSGILVGIISQFWLRNYHPGWFRKYNNILGAALDAGSQVMLFILSFAVFGASGSLPRPFPAWAGNPANGNTDYCNGNGIFT